MNDTIEVHVYCNMHLYKVGIYYTVTYSSVDNLR